MRQDKGQKAIMRLAYGDQSGSKINTIDKSQHSVTNGQQKWNGKNAG